MTKNPAKILVIDDSELMRQNIITILNPNQKFTIIGEAAHGKDAIAKIFKLEPDVIILDVTMPEMKGLSTLKYIMIFCPKPILILSDLTEKGSNCAFDTLRYGAVNFIHIPSKFNTNPKDSLQSQAKQIMQQVSLATKVKPNAIQYIRINEPKQNKIPAANQACKNLIIIGVAEGGYSALIKILPNLKLTSTTTIIVVFYEETQYIDKLIAYLNPYCSFNLQRPEHDVSIKTGECYINSGAEYITVNQTKHGLKTHISPAPFASHRGAIDMLMFSAAEILTNNVIGIILSGDGVDGGEGIEEIVRMGGKAIIQAPINCLYKNMPLSALNLCEAETVVVDTEIANEINTILDLHSIKNI